MSKPRVYYFMVGGAGNEVTGSCTVLRIEYNDKIYYGLVDTGIVQGPNSFRNFNFPIEASKLDFVVLTHSHADHSGGLPMLKGFNGKLYATLDGFKQAKEILEDSALNHEQEAVEELGVPFEAYQRMCAELERLEKRGATNLERYKALSNEVKEIRSGALYLPDDVEEISKFFTPILPYQDVKIDDGIYIRTIPSTHQNGAVSVELYVGNYSEDSVNISFSGDVGPSDSFLYRNHEYTKNHLINFCVMESLHGLEEKKQTPEDAHEELTNIVLDGLKKGKTVIEVVFALDRSAITLYSNNRAKKERNVQFKSYFDSKLAVKELIHYQNAYNSKDNLWFKDLGPNPFSTEETIILGKYAAHMNVVRSSDPKVVITASAFGEGGRVLDYFDHYIQDENAIFIFLGWLSPECNSYKLLNAQKGEIIELHGTQNSHYVKHCETYQISGFSSHGYYPEFVEYIERFPNLKGLILNHAATETKEALRDKLKESYGFDICIPEMYDSMYRSFYTITSSDGIQELPVLEGYDVFKDVLINSVL